MATLEEMRRWAQGGEVKGLPRKVEVKPVESTKSTPPPVPPTVANMTGYRIDPSGTDALIKFGKHRGKTLSQLADPEGGDQGYLRWIIRDSNYGDDLKDVCKKVLEETRFSK